MKHANQSHHDKTPIVAPTRKPQGVKRHQNTQAVLNASAGVNICRVYGEGTDHGDRTYFQLQNACAGVQILFHEIAKASNILYNHLNAHGLTSLQGVAFRASHELERLGKSLLDGVAIQPQGKPCTDCDACPLTPEGNASQQYTYLATAGQHLETWNIENTPSRGNSLTLGGVVELYGLVKLIAMHGFHHRNNMAKPLYPIEQTRGAYRNLLEFKKMVDCITEQLTPLDPAGESERQGHIATVIGIGSVLTSGVGWAGYTHPVTELATVVQHPCYNGLYNLARLYNDQRDAGVDYRRNGLPTTSHRRDAIVRHIATQYPDAEGEIRLFNERIDLTQRAFAPAYVLKYYDGVDPYRLPQPERGAYWFEYRNATAETHPQPQEATQ